MNEQKKYEKCRVFYENLSNKLEGEYESVASCNQDLSAYLCPIGTADEITYHGKPEMSFRISDHWNWYSNTKKCSDPNYIQCYCNMLPYPKPRLAPGKASKPIQATCVALFMNGKYHVVYGEYFHKKSKTWKWMNNTVDEVLSQIFNYQEKELA